MSRLKIGFIGCGGIACVHRDNLIHHGNVDLVGCCDTVHEQAEAFAAASGIPIFKDIVSLYNTACPHAVYVSVPPFAHGEIELEAAARGIYLFIEPPIALDVRMARAISVAVRKANILAMTGYCRRYADLTQTAHHILSGEVISLATGRYHCGLPSLSWSRCREQSGGLIVEQASHVVDLLLYLCGPVSEVHALGSQGCMPRTSHLTMDESNVINLRLKNGAVASISCTCILNHPGSVSLEIVTPSLCLALSDDALRIREDHKITEHLNHMNMYKKETEVFIHAVEQGRHSGIRSAYSEALKTLKVTLAANDSIQTGLPVVL